MADGTMLMADYSNHIRNYQQNHRECSYTPKKMSCMMNSFVLFCFLGLCELFVGKQKSALLLLSLVFGWIFIWLNHCMAKTKTKTHQLSFYLLPHTRSAQCHAHTHPVVGRPQLTDGTLLFVRSNDIIDNCVNAYFVGHFAQCSSQCTLYKSMWHFKDDFNMEIVLEISSYNPMIDSDGCARYIERHTCHNGLLNICHCDTSIHIVSAQSRFPSATHGAERNT